MLDASGKCGKGLSLSASERISAILWPVPWKNLSARSGLTVIYKRRPLVSSSAGSATVIDGMKRASLERDHGMSIDFGFWMVAIPMAPAAMRNFQRSPLEE